MHALSSGRVLHGRYRIMRQIGKGGMGAVYEATDSRLQNTVAVKQMTATGHDDAFEREARLLAALRHPGLPVVIDYFSDNGHRFLVMQYIEGENLAHVLQRWEACDEEDVVSWGIAILDVLIYLHEHRPAIVHRDIKPANIKLTPRGDVVLLDFGLAKGRPQSETPVDDFRSVYGFTPRYAPIEQIEWSGSDVRSDLYALGATLFHLVTGVPPASSRARASALSESRPDPLRPATEVRSNVTGAFSRVLARALEMDPARRFASAHEMRNALANHPGGRTLPKPLPESADQRRVDAAMPSQAQVGLPVDLLVQVRFRGSPLLGLEDWPTKRLPAKIEQQSETLHLDYPRDPTTGVRLPARLRIKVVAPSLVIDGQSEHLIEVPPDEYSKRLVFLLTPQRAGLCRLNVEVYAVDALYLGTIPVEAEAVAIPVANPVFRVANLVLALFTRERDTAATAIETAPEITLSSDREEVLPSHSFPVPKAALSDARLDERLKSGLPVDESISAGARARGRRLRWISVAPPLIVLIGVVFVSLYSFRMWRAPSPSDQAALPPSVKENPPAVPPTSTPSAPAVDTAKLRKEIETKLHRAETAMKEGRLEFARHEVESVLAEESANPRARKLQQQIRAAVSQRASAPASTPIPSAPLAREAAVPVAETVNRARDLIKQRNYGTAVGTVVGALGKVPKNAELLGVLQEALQAAENDATAEKRAADVANAASRVEYTNATSRFQSAVKAKESGRPEDADSAIKDYSAAASLYRAAAARAKETTVTPPSDAEAEIRQLLAQYEAAYESLDADRVRRLRPAFKSFPTGLVSTDLTISNVRISLAPDRQSATVSLTVQFRNTFARGVPPEVINPRAANVVWRVERTPTGWIIVD